MHLLVQPLSFQDDCCDRSIESEVSTLHSQDEVMSEEHTEGQLDGSVGSTGNGAKPSHSFTQFQTNVLKSYLFCLFLLHKSYYARVRLHHAIQADYNLPLLRFRRGVLQQGVGEQSHFLEDENFEHWTPEFVGHRREDDWSNR